MSYKMIASAFTLAVMASMMPTDARAKGHASMESYPRLIARVKTPECKQVLKAAKILFDSKAPHLTEDATAVQKANLGLVLAPQGLDGTAPYGQSFWIDQKYIDTDTKRTKKTEVPAATEDATALDTQEATRGAFWQKEAIDGCRFVVGQKPMNWEGDWFDLYVVDEAMPVDKLTEFVQNAAKEPQTELKSEKDAYVIYRNLWHRPWLYYNQDTKRMVAVNTQASWLDTSEHELSNWAIYATDGKARAKCIGVIEFCPKGKSFSLLPKGPLRDLALLLDKIIGIPSQEEGSLRPTPRLRIAAANTWANLVLRPWALDKPGNSKLEVEQGLKQWAKGSPVYKKQYAQLQSLYPQALQALTEHYQNHLHKSPVAARKLATSSLEIAYRNNFRF